jgi:hypothetical protein
LGRVHIALFDQSRNWLIMKEDIYSSLFHWVSRLGGTVSMDYGRLEPQALNIIVGLQYLSPEQIHDIAASSLDYGVFDIEFVAEKMVNFKPNTSWLFLREGQLFFERCRFFLSYFRDSVRMLQDMGVFSRHFVPGYCQNLEWPGKISEKEKTIDVLFFGNVDRHRRSLLERMSKRINITVHSPQDVTPLLLRNAHAAQSRIVLSLGRARPFTHIGPMRLVSMAHLRAFSLSEPSLLPQPELAGLCVYWDAGQDPVEQIELWLADDTRRHRQAEAAYERIRQIDPVPVLAEALEYRRP